MDDQDNTDDDGFDFRVPSSKSIVDEFKTRERLTTSIIRLLLLRSYGNFFHVPVLHYYCRSFTKTTNNTGTYL